MQSAPNCRLTVAESQATAVPAHGFLEVGVSPLQQVSQWGPHASSSSTTWEFVRHADSRGLAVCFTKLPDDSHARSGVRTIELR